MADNSVIRITTVYDASPIITGNQQAAASTDQATQQIQAALIKAGLAYKQYMADVRAQADQVAELNAALGTSAAAGSETAAAAIRDAGSALDTYIDKAAAAKTQVLELTAALRAQGGAAQGSTPAAPTESAQASASSFEGLAATGTIASGAGASAAGYEAMIAAEEGAATAGATLNEVEQASVLANEEVAASATLSAEAWAREAGIESATAATTERSTVFGRLLASVKQSVASALGLETQAVTTETAAMNGSAEAAEKSAGAWAAYAGVQAETTEAVVAEGEAETVRAAAMTGGIGATRAATAEFRILEGGLAGSTRGAAAFLTNTLKLGPVLQAAFPVFGAVAFGAIIYEVTKGIVNFYENTVLLKGQIEAMGDASARTAKQAAEANWKYIESYAELLKAQNKFAEAQAFEQAHAGEKPETLSLGIDKKKLKEFPEDFQEFANSLEHVNTQGKDAASAFDQIDQRIAKLTAELASAKTAAQDANEALDETLSTPGSEPGMELEIQKQAAARLTLTQEMLDALQNMHNKHVSDVGAEYNKGATAVITLTEKQFSDLDALEKAHAEAAKRVAESQIAVKEEEAKHELATGQITADQELAMQTDLAKRKLQVEIDYLAARDASLAKAPPSTPSADRAGREVIENQGQQQALRNEMGAKEIAGEDAIVKAKLKIRLDAINEEIEAVKAVPAASVAAEAAADAKIVELHREAMAAVAAAKFGPGSEQYESVYRGLEEAQRTAAEFAKKTSDEATQHQLENLDRLLSAEENAAVQRARVAQGALQNEIKQQQDAAALRQSQQIRPQGGITGAVFDQSQLGSNTAAQQSAAEVAAVDQEKIEQTLTAEKIALLRQEQAARDAALAAGTISEQQYADQSMKIHEEITKDVQDNAAKQEEIKQKEAAELEKIAQQEAQKEMQIQEQIANTLARETDKMIFQTKNLHDAMTKLWTDAVKFIIEQIVKMAAEYIARMAMMVIAKHAADAALNKGEAVADTGGGAAAAASKTTEATATTALATATTTLNVAQKQQQATLATLTPAETAQATALKAATIPITPLIAQTQALAQAEKFLATAFTSTSTAIGSATAAAAADTAANAANAESDIGLAAATVFLEAIEQIEFPANIAAAPALAGETYSEGAVYIAAASAEGGWDMPSGGPFPMFGHSEEMMLPRPIAEGFRNIINDQSSRVTSGDTNSQSSTNFHYHAGPVHALDQSGVDSVMAKHSKRFSKAVTDGIRAGRIDPRTFAGKAR